ncbi:MAG TPA: TIGR04282 family arsenosugar biosynthesis glycosyltransferase [bacterium]|nr:TIGR04282 family arsenosugar biosynthesis glycosyltransferase [bacterium]
MAARNAAAGWPPLASLHLVLFSRAPVPGQTKTRLCPPLTPAQAVAVHVACLNDLLAEGRAWAAARRASGGIPVSLHLCITPAASQTAFRAAGVAWPNDYALHNQRGPHLGTRMEHAIRRAQRDAPAPAGVLLVGSDLPLLGAAQWDAAADALATADAVFGPTPDGGYYLVGTRRDPVGLFALQGWGGTTVLEQSLAAARAAGFQPALIEALPDADTAADLHAVLAHARAAALADRASLRLIRELLRT